MQNAYCNFLSAVNKSVRGTIGLLAVLTLTAGATPSPSAVPPHASAELPEVQVQEIQKSANGNQFQIGDRISLQVELTVGAVEAGQELSLKLPSETEKLEDLGWYLDPNNKNLGGTLRFIVSPIQTGALTLPSLIISPIDGKPFAKTSPFQIQVSGPKAEKEKQPELLPVISIGLPWQYWVILILLASLLGWIGFRVYKKIRSRMPLPKPLETPTPPLEPNHILALRKIDQLFSQHPFSILNLKPIAFGCSEILKDFFSIRFKVDASESTTEEMLELLRQEALPKESLKEIQNLFADLDLIKFTREENYAHLKEEHYQQIKVRAQLIIQRWALQGENKVGGTS